MSSTFYVAPFTSPQRVKSFNLKLRAATPRAMQVAIDPKHYRATVEAEIDAHILKSLPTTPPRAVTDPMRHLVSITPKTIASALCVAACELVGGERDDAIAAASALQLMHAAAYVHGRLPPLLGPASSRPVRPGPFSLGVELMTGDGLVPLGYEVVASAERGDPERRLRVILEITETMGARGVAEAQLMEAEGGEEEAGRREGRLAACGAACGAILGGGSEEAVERLRRCGMYAGMVNGLMGGDEAEELRLMARSELGAFEVERAAAVCGLLDLWFEGER